MTQELRLTKNKEVYVLRYDEGQESRVLDTLVEMVNRTDLSFDWFDAAILSQQLGKRLATELKQLPKKKE